jgi:hypothetical protein
MGGLLEIARASALAFGARSISLLGFFVVPNRAATAASIRGLIRAGRRAAGYVAARAARSDACALRRAPRARDPAGARAAARSSGA